MKPVFKCDYCSKMGTEEEIREHEEQCAENYNKRSCYTCTHKRLTSKDGKWIFECKIGKEIPIGKLFEYCDIYEQKEEPRTFGDIFGDWWFKL